MQKAITVTTLNNQIKALLESHYINTTVTGEVSRVTYHSSGHLYFTLKDKNSSISCVMFKGNKRSLKFTLEDGMGVVLLGAVSVYTPRGSYQLNVISLEPEGGGALALAYEQLKEKLKEKGYFDSDIKKELPKFPKTIALITSKTGAALQDMLRVAQNRYPLVKLILLDTQVQGEGSCEMIVANIKKADSLKVDIIIVGRGGGSVEDLWAFNQERVADAIFEANTPIISAVGHEIDFLISDFCADVRASTPSNAIEIALADKSELLIMLDSYMDRFDEKLQNIIIKKLRDLDHLKELLKHSSPITKLTHIENEIQIISQNLNS
ncbi:MAG TPA: exodeoxyribonuclease VII large subunit, partial [Campylobacterales bacterium]|nr:exodeoxyribonuclease VII large subunit [Campylobacterales bacterium]